MLKIDKYYDIRCDCRCKSRSLDINGGLGMWEQIETRRMEMPKRQNTLSCL